MITFLIWIVWLWVTYSIAKNSFHIGYLTAEINKHRLYMKIVDEIVEKQLNGNDAITLFINTPIMSAEQSWKEHRPKPIKSAKAKIKNLITTIKNTYGTIWKKRGN